MHTPLLLQNLNLAPGRPPGAALPEGMKALGPDGMKALDSEGLAKEFAAILQGLGDRLGQGLPLLQGVDQIILTDAEGLPVLPSTGTELTPEQEATQMLAALMQLLGVTEEGGQAPAGVDGEPVTILTHLKPIPEGSDALPPELAPLLELLAQLPDDLRADVERLLQAGKLLPPPPSADGTPEQSELVPPTKGELHRLLTSLKEAVAELVAPAKAAGQAAVTPTPAAQVSAIAESKVEPDAKPESPELLALRSLVARMVSGDPSSPEVLQGRRADLAEAVAGLRDSAGPPPSPLAAAPGPAQASAAGTAMRSLLAEGPSFAQAIPVPPGHPQWGQALGERVLWLVGREVQSAEVRLNPPQLGPLEIRVAVQNDQASVTFHAQHPLTREALEQALPRLREMLAENNLNLVSVDVGQKESGHARGGPGNGGRQNGEAFGWDGESPDGTPEGARTVARVTSGLVDDFA